MISVRSVALTIVWANTACGGASPPEANPSPPVTTTGDVGAPSGGPAPSEPAPSAGGAEQQLACTQPEAAIVSEALSRMYLHTQQVIQSGGDLIALMQFAEEEDARLRQTVSARCLDFVTRLMQAQQQQQQSGAGPWSAGSPDISEGSVTYDAGSDTYYAPGVACAPSGCVAF